MTTGASDFFALARDFTTGGAKTAVVLYDAFKAGGEAFAADWKHNAEQTSGEHGKHYPNSITSETKLAVGILVDTGPDSSKPQGRMGRGFEFGSQNQPAHLDGLHALPLAQRRIDKLADAAIAFVLP